MFGVCFSGTDFADGVRLSGAGFAGGVRLSGACIDGVLIFSGASFADVRFSCSGFGGVAISNNQFVVRLSITPLDFGFVNNTIRFCFPFGFPFSNVPIDFGFPFSREPFDLDSLDLTFKD